MEKNPRFARMIEADMNLKSFKVNNLIQHPEPQQQHCLNHSPVLGTLHSIKIDEKKCSASKDENVFSS
jgi:hypothetical protein